MTDRRDPDLYISHLNGIKEDILQGGDFTDSIEKDIRTICSSADAMSSYLDLEIRYFTYIGLDDGDRETMKRIADLSGIDEYPCYLALLDMLTLKAEDVFRAKGLPRKVYYDTLKDIYIWEEVCLHKYGVKGISNTGWVSLLVKSDIIRLGRLEFHMIEYGGPEFSDCGVTVKKGDRVINVHIPEGSPFPREERYESYRMAYKTFGMAGRAVFVCDSWLLYEKQREFLFEGSNILDFMDDFNIVESKDASPSVNDDAWRIFGFDRDDGDLDSFPHDTRLQRCYLDWLKSGGSFGVGKGIFIHDGEKIISPKRG